MPITLVMKREVLSGNTLAYGHWRNRSKDRKNWEAWILHALSKDRPANAKATGHRIVQIVAHRKRTLDDDNLSSGCKHLRDALITTGLLIDDNKKGAKFSYEQHIMSDSPYPAPATVVTIWTEGETPC
jgi:hypothetical protein